MISKKAILNFRDKLEIYNETSHNLNSSSFFFKDQILRIKTDSIQN